MARCTASARASTRSSAATSAVPFARSEIAAKIPTSSATDTVGKRNIDSHVSQTMQSSTLTGSVLISAPAVRGRRYVRDSLLSLSPRRGFLQEQRDDETDHQADGGEVQR